MQDADYSSMAEGRVQIINHFTFLEWKMGSSGDSVIAEAVVFFMINTVYVACAGQWGMNAKLRIQPRGSTHTTVARGTALLESLV